MSLECADIPAWLMIKFLGFAPGSWTTDNVNNEFSSSVNVDSSEVIIAGFITGVLAAIAGFTTFIADGYSNELRDWLIDSRNYNKDEANSV